MSQCDQGGMVPGFTQWVCEGERASPGRVLRVRVRKMPNGFGKTLKGAIR